MSIQQDLFGGIMKKEIIVYSKFCLKCFYPNESKKMKIWADENNVNLKIRRTAYRPDWHKKATNLWGDENYEAFIVLANGEVKDFVSFFNKTKKKPIKAGKMKGNNGVLGLRETEGDNREIGVEMESVEANEDNKEE